jgi:uncharacterized membrane protein
MQAANEHIQKDGFRLRGTAMSRLDGFSDVVFGFALTLLVVSLEVPHTYDELHQILLGFYPFAVCFALFIFIWYGHFKFFRRYGLHDVTTIILNCSILFTVLAYVYPLKFLFTQVALGTFNHYNRHVFSNDMQLRELVTVYGAGFAAIYLLFSALQWNAWRQRRNLRLSPLETTLTLSYLLHDLGLFSIGLLCCLLAHVLPPAYAGNACYCFLLAIVWRPAHILLSRRSIRAARARTSAPDLHSLPHAS